MESDSNPHHESLARLDLLITDYSHGRDDERQLELVQAALLTITLASFFGVLTVMSGIRNNTEAPNASTPDYLEIATYALAPLGVILPAIVAEWVAGRAILRSFYLRALEHEIRAEYLKTTTKPPESLSLEDSYPGLHVFSIMDLLVQRGSMKSLTSQGGMLLGAVALSYAAGSFGLVAVSMRDLLAMNTTVSTSVAYGTLSVCSVSTILLIADAWTVNIHGRRFFASTVSSYQTRLIGTLKDNRESKPGYSMALPRPDDLGKVLFSIIGVAVGLVDYFMTTNSWPMGTAGIAILLGIVFETTFYQTRYIVNDLMGIQEDSTSAHQRTRQRIPAEVQYIHSALRAILLRTGLCVIVLFALWKTSRSVFIVFTIGAIATIALTFVYELFRSAERRSKSRFMTTVSVVVVFFVVTLGYPLRVFIGYNVFTDILGPEGTPTAPTSSAHHHISLPMVTQSQFASDLYPAMLLFSIGCGLVFVSLTWLLESCSSYQISLSNPKELTHLFSTKPHANICWNAFCLRMPHSAEEYLAHRGGVSESEEVSPAEIWRRSIEDGGTHRPRLSIWIAATPWSLGSLIVSFSSVVCILGFPSSSGPLLRTLLLCAALWIVCLTSEFLIQWREVRGFTILLLDVVALFVVEVLIYRVYPSADGVQRIVSALTVLGGSLIWHSMLFQTYDSIHGWGRRLTRSIGSIPKEVGGLITNRLLGR